LGAATEAVQAAFKGHEVEIKARCVDDYPVRVRIFDSSDGNEVQLYKIDQRRLYRKYAEWRSTELKNIEAALRKHFKL
jgi:ribosomal protein L21